MVPSASVSDCGRKERVQKTFSVDHHEHGDARLSALLNPLSGVSCDYVSSPVALVPQLTVRFSTTGANMVCRTKERALDPLLVPALLVLATPSIC